MSEQSPKVIFQPSGRQGRVPVGTALLEAARLLGVEIESICAGRQTCGKCQIEPEFGHFAKHGIHSQSENISPVGPEESDYFARRRARNPNRRLSCAARVLGDLVITVPEEHQARKQIVCKSATPRAVTVDPAVRQYYAQVEPASLGDRRGDWELLQDALRRDWGMTDLSIDITALVNLPKRLRAQNWAVTVIVWNEQEVRDVQPGYVEGVYGLAVDLGTTTIAGHLCDLRTGAVLSTETLMNPQVKYGEDLMSRISYAMLHDDGLERMHKAVIQGLNQLAGRAAVAAGLKPRDINELVLVGNTVMQEIFLGADPVELGSAPFALVTHDAVDVKARDLGLKLHPGANVHVLPSQAGHVGGDNVGVLLAEAPHQSDEVTLIVDIGTNGEILLGNRNRLLSASAPTGPAFEGAQITHGMRAAPGSIERVRIDPDSQEPRFKVIGQEAWSDELVDEEIGAAGICGSGIIEAVAELYTAGIIDKSGRFQPEARSERVRWQGRRAEYVLATATQTSSASEIVVTQEDVRAIQLAKGALRAGAELLMQRYGITEVERIILAGAFGSYISPLHAIILGLIPPCDLEKVYPVGNAAGDGALLALLSREKRAEARRMARRVEYYEIAVEPKFQEAFVAALPLYGGSEEEIPKEARSRRRERRKNRIEMMGV